MKRFVAKWLCTAGAVVVLMPVLGCAIGADVFSPGLFSALGLDTYRLQPAQGTVIVNFHNETPFVVGFYAFESADSVDFTQDSRNITVSVDPGQQRNELVDCPVDIISPGGLDADFMYTTLAAQVFEVDANGGVQTQDVAYAGQFLRFNVEFNCGDVIDITAIVDPAADSGYRLVVRVVPGQ